MNLAQVLRHYEINQIIGVWQAVTCEQLYRYLAIETRDRSNMLARALNIICISIQPMDQVAIIRTQSGS